ncbi:MAG: 23S rRNA (adenine(2503)-C(2))-methyltransferase RlmN [Anaerolineae bacterium]
MLKKINILDLEFDELVQFFETLGQPRYRARQVWQWLYRRYAVDFHSMTNLPANLRRQLDEAAYIDAGQIVSSQSSSDGKTRKILTRLNDGQTVETVLMRYEKRRTLCISTQAGCAMGCVFCATGQMGFFRHLTAGEIMAPVLHFARELAATHEHVTNIVMMGMGEPLHNYENTLRALDRLTDPEGFDLGARKITISSVGLVPAIRRYAEEKRQSPLAISLHAATDEERGRLIPVNRRWPIAELMDTCRYYIEKTGRRITFEWALIRRENDTIEQAQGLGRLVSGMLCHVNLIPLNPTQGYAGRPSSRRRVSAFQEELARYGVSSTVRVRRGIDIQAGCGQLRDRAIAEAAAKSHPPKKE